MRNTADALRVIRAAEKWWDSKCPLSFTKEEHVANPTVNCTSDSQNVLAQAVAAYVSGTGEAQ
jgi:hypothetical protein